MNRWKMRSSFTHLLVSYLIILCIPFLIGTFIYLHTVEMLEDEARSSNMTMLKQNSDLLERQLGEAENSATTLAINPKVVQFMEKKRPLSSDDYFQIHEILLDMRKYDLNPLVDGYYLYFPTSQLLMSSTNVFKLPEDYGEAFQVEGMGFTDWERYFQYDGRDEKYFPTQTLMIQTQPKTVMTYQKMIFSGYAKDPGASVIVHFREEELNRLFRTGLTHDEGWAAILDVQGNTLFLTGEHSVLTTDLQKAVFGGTNSGYAYAKVNGERQFVSYIRSDSTGWTYVAALPEEIVLAKANYIQTITLVVTLLSLLIGISYAFWMARKNSAPVKKLIEDVKDYIQGEHKRKNDYELVQDTVIKLVSNHHDLQKSMELQLPYLQASFLEQLLQGGFQTNDELESHAAFAQIAMKSKHYFVIVIRFISYNQNVTEQKLYTAQRGKEHVKRIASRLKSNVLFHDISEECIAAIVPLDTNEYPFDRDEFMRTMRQVMNLLLQKCDIQLAAGIGGIVDDQNELWMSFREAQKALEYTKRSEFGIVWHDELRHDTSLYHFPHDVELRLMNSVKAGDTKSLSSVMEHLEKENFVNRALNDYMMTQFLYHLNGTLIRLFDELTKESGEVKEHFMRLERPDQAGHISYFEQMKKLLLRLCDVVSEEQRCQQKRLLFLMKQFIEQNYNDSGLSLAAVADHFQLSESYTSTFFKDQSGQTFSDYLEAVRMKEACRLLRETELPIAEIAEHTGYNSDKAFRRAFKRVNQLLPTAYRKMSVKQDVKAQ